MRHRAENALHHGQVFEVVVRLEQCHALVQLEQDAADAPDVARMAPAELENHLGSAIVTRRHNRAVVLVVERRRAKVDQPNRGVFDFSKFFSLLGGEKQKQHVNHSRRKIVNKHMTNLARNLNVKVRVDKKNVFRLQVGVRKFIVV